MHLFLSIFFGGLSIFPLDRDLPETEGRIIYERKTHMAGDTEYVREIWDGELKKEKTWKT